jgi:membrane associated rhomboid family serine protease
MIRIWLAGAVGGGLFHLAFGGNGLLVGASGMVCATILADSASFPHARLPVLRIAAKNLGLGILFASAILTAMTWCQSLPAWLAPASSIGHACHLGGALAGYAVAKIQRTQRR